MPIPATINIFSDKWIAGLASGTPTLLPQAVQEVNVVQDLMIGIGRWNEDKIARLFTPSDAALIINIPLSRRLVADRLSWKLAKNGQYSVKTTYMYVFTKSVNYSPLEFSLGVHFWKKLWKTNIPNKAKVHGWRVCLDILPSLGSLEKKRVVLETNLRVLCERAGETTLHLCRDCDYTKQVLQVNPVLNSICYRWGDIATDALSWLKQCALDLSLEGFSELLFSLWNVWKERNDRVWKQKKMAALDVSSGIAIRLQEFRRHNPKLKGRVVSGVKWKAPPPGTWKINVDGAFQQVTKCGGMSFVIRDFSGNIVAGGAGPLRGLISAEHAELLACRLAVDFATTQGFQPFILETDATEVQRQLAAYQVSNSSTLGRVYEDVGFLLHQHTQNSVVSINRQGNTVAHTLPAYACSLEQNAFYFSTPLVLQATIAAELCNF